MKKIKQIEPYFDSSELHSVNKTLKSTFITEGKKTELFENIIKKKNKFKICCFNQQLDIRALLLC